MRVLTVLMPLLACGGCFSVALDDLAKDPPVKQRYLFDVVIPTNAGDPSRAQHPVLLVEQVHAASPYNGRPFVYRTGDNTHETDFFNEFLISAADQLSQITRRWLQDAGVFPVVVSLDSAITADLWLTIDITELRGDFRDLQQPSAVLAIRASLIDGVSNGGERQVRLQNNYAATVPIAGTDPDLLVAGWNEAIARVLSALSEDLERTN